MLKFESVLEIEEGNYERKNEICVSWKCTSRTKNDKKE